MKGLTKKYLLIIISLALSAGVFKPVEAAGNCSPYLGLATINELFRNKTNQTDDPADFVEIKILDSSIPLATFSQWSIQLCENNGAGNNNDNDGCSAKISVGDFTDITIPWLVLKDGTIGKYFNFKTGFDAILLDANDDVIDYLSVDGHTQLENPGCTGASLPYDYQASAPGASDKFIFRAPDGTGDWGNATSAAEDPSEDTSNDIDPSVPTPSLVFSEPTIVRGTTTASVTLTLDFASSDIISINFSTFNGTLTAGTDYTSVNITADIAAGDTSLTLSVPVSATANLGYFYFLVSMDPASVGKVSIGSQVGKITVIGAPAVDHFNISVGAGSASTCSPFNFSVTAQDAGNNPVTNYSGTTLITTSTANGKFSTVSATNNTNPNPDNDDNGSAGYTFDTLDNGAVTLALENEHAETLTISVTDSSIPLTSTSVDITFSDNAFTIIDNDAVVAGNDIPVAGRNHSYQVQMIRKDPISGVCDIATGYTGPKLLKMWRTKNVSDPSPNNPALSGTSLPAADPGVDNGSITFVGGVADVTLTTTDIGKFTIELADISNTFAATTIAGTSSEQTVRPFGIGIDFSNLRDADFTDNGFIDDSTGSDLSYASGIAGSVFTQAGEDFSITVEGVLWSMADDLDNDGVPDVSAYLGNNTATPSFGLEGETITLTAAVVEPVGATLGGLSVNGVAGGLFNSFTSGSQTAVMTYSNVGIINLTATLTDTDYFLSGVNVTGLASNVGRFNPFQYAVTASTVNSACSVVLPFTYSRQPFTTNITLQAENKGGVRTDGYRGLYATLDIATELNIENSVTNTAYDNESFTAGSETFSSNTFGLSNFNVDLTWNMALQVETVSQVNIVDTSDEVTLISASPVSAGSTEVRFGRLALDNVFGSELVILTMPMYTEYYNGSNFVLNLDDGCTVINDADVAPGVTNILTGGSSTTTVVSPTANNGTLNIDIALTPSGAGNTGDVVITLDLISIGYPWLQFDWDGDTAHDNDPTATATFGVFSGNDVNIYKLQIYQ